MEPLIDSVSSSTAPVVPTISLEDQLRLRKAADVDDETSDLGRQISDKAASIEHTRHASFVGEVSPETAAIMIQTAGLWRRMDRRKETKHPLTIGLNLLDLRDPSLIDTLAVYDYLRLTRADGHALTMAVNGQGNMQAACLLQVGSERVMSPNSWLFLNQTQAAVAANSAAAEDELRFLQDVEDSVHRLTCANSKLSVETLKQKTDGRSVLRLSAEEALEYGLIDRIGLPIAAPNPGLLLPGELRAPGGSPLEKLQRAELRNLFVKEHLRAMDRAVEIQDGEPARLCVFGVIDFLSVMSVSHALKQAFRRGTRDFTLLINSPGGNVVQGQALIDVIDELKTKGCKFTTVALGQASSMAGFLLACGDIKVMARNARLLIHRISTIFHGVASERADQLAIMKRLEAQVLPRMVTPKLSVEELQKRCEHRNWWLTAEEALEFDIIHEIW